MTAERDLSELAFERLGRERDLFALDHLADLIRSDEDVSRLEDAVTQLAVRGHIASPQAVSGPVKGPSRPSSSDDKHQRSADFPDHWAVATLTQLCSVVPQTAKVKTTEIEKFGDFPVVDQGKAFVAGYVSDIEPIRVEEPLVVFGDHTREVKVIDFDFVIGADGVKLLRPIGVSADWLYYVLRAFRPPSRGYGRHFHLLKEVLFPVPPPQEEGLILDFLSDFREETATLRRLLNT